VVRLVFTNTAINSYGSKPLKENIFMKKLYVAIAAALMITNVQATECPKMNLDVLDNHTVSSLETQLAQDDFNLAESDLLKALVSTRAIEELKLDAITNEKLKVLGVGFFKTVVVPMMRDSDSFKDYQEKVSEIENLHCSIIEPLTNKKILPVYKMMKVGVFKADQ